MNLPPFYVGQKVVYITGLNAPKDSIHTVKGIWMNNCGNCWAIDIGIEIVDHKGKYNHYHCSQCSKKYWAVSKGGWQANSFRPLEQLKFPLMKYTKVIEKELVSEN